MVTRQNWKVHEASGKLGFVVRSICRIYIKLVKLSRVIERSFKWTTMVIARFKRVVQGFRKIFSLGFFKVFLIERVCEKGKQKGCM